MSKDLLLEIGVEEIPSRFMKTALEELKINASKVLEDNRIAYKAIKTWGTARRLVLYIEQVAIMQAEEVSAVRGPKKSAGYDKEMKASKALQGFATAQKLKVEELVVKEVNGIEYFFALKNQQGVASETLLPSILEEIIRNLSFPKPMRWAYSEMKFVRPIRWLLALYGGKIINISIEDISSQAFTYGHRFLSTGPLKLQSIEEYFSVLREAYVILDQEERKTMILEQIAKLAELRQGVAMQNDELIEEIVYLVEYPCAFCGDFSVDYLQVPSEVLSTSMIEHQKYVPLFDKEQNLLPSFIGVRNGIEADIDIVKAGNERVLKARLEDALFFWHEDQKSSLEEKAKGLKNVTYHDRIGSLMDKTLSLEKIAAYIANNYKLSTKEQASRAAHLSKADLLSSMVYEFPELQGIMGRYYAEIEGESGDVAQAIFEQYLPRFAEDALPKSDLGLVLSLSEKIYNIVASFAINLKPSGSQDPYALRRQALGISNMVLDKALEIELKTLVECAYNSLGAIELDLSLEQCQSEVVEFILQRLRWILGEQGVAYDVLDAVFIGDSDKLHEIYLRCLRVDEYKKSEKYEDFMVVFNRAYRLSKNFGSQGKETLLKSLESKNQVSILEVKESLLQEDSEKQLWASYQERQARVEKALAARDYIQALNIIAELRIEVDNFFDSLMIMVDQEEIKNNRLAILKNISLMAISIADFSKLV